jgi:AAA domain
VRDVVPYIIETLRHRYDLVIIDAPPFLGLPDAARFLQAADSVVIVVRRRAARLYQVRRLIDRMKVLGARPVGTVVNMAAPRDEDLAYGYPEPGQGIEEPIASDQPPGRDRGRPSKASGTTRIRRTIGRRLKKDDVPVAPTARPAPPPAPEAAPAEAPPTRPEPVEEPVATMGPTPGEEAEAEPPSEPDSWAELREWTEDLSEDEAQGEDPSAPDKPAAGDRGDNGRRRTRRPSGEKPPTQSGR